VVCLVDPRGGVEWLSRGGRPVNTLSHLNEAARKGMLASGLNKGCVFDGEALVVGSSFEESISAVKRGTAKEGASVVFLAFDLLSMKEWKEKNCPRIFRDRRTLLQTAANAANETHQLFGATQLMSVGTLEDAQKLFYSWRAQGLEGAVIKTPHGLYSFKRSKDWMKLKAETTVDVVITGAIEGKGKHSGRLGAFTFVHNGEECRAGTGFSDDQRTEFWNWHKGRFRKRPPFIGLTAEVEFTEATAAGRTRHARFVRLREFGGERE
jgi:DNA ligase-1